jgi:cytochrome c-type biogenesis protein CcmH
VTDISKALRELLLARAAGMIDAEEFERRQAALHAELLADNAARSRRHWWILGATAAVVALGIGVYAWKARGPATAPAGLPAMMPAAPGAPEGMPPQQGNRGGDLSAMALRLAEKLAKDPTNGEGWALLGQTYVELRQHKEADHAFAKAAALGQVDARLLAEWADAHVVANDRKWDKTARDLVARALAADGRNLKALSLSGSEAFDRSDYKRAIAQWQKLREAAPADSMDAKLADANIAEARAAMSGRKAAPAAAAEAAPNAAAIAGTVALDPALKGRVAPTDTVFVIARAPEGGGAPLAVRRYGASELPVIFSLTDADAMMPERKLSRFPEVLVSARLSKSGNAMPQAGDLASPAVRAKAGAADIKLELKAP